MKERRLEGGEGKTGAEQDRNDLRTYGESRPGRDGEKWGTVCSLMRQIRQRGKKERQD